MSESAPVEEGALNSEGQMAELSHKLSQFFHEFYYVSEIQIPPKLPFFPITPPIRYEPNPDEEKKMKSFSEKKNKKMFKYLLSHPNLCDYAIRAIPSSFFVGNAKSNLFSENFFVSIYGNSVRLLKQAFVDTPNSSTQKVNRKELRLIQSRISTITKNRSLQVEFSSRYQTIPFVLDDIACASAFAASQSEVFIGQAGGLVRVVSVGADGSPIVKYNLWRSVGNVPYSLLCVHEMLFMITEKQAFMIDVCRNVVTEIKDKPEMLAPPLATDGHFFYAAQILTHKGKLSIYSFDFKTRQFVPESKLVLRGMITDVYFAELKIQFITDGIRITFASPRGRVTHFVEFSLETGLLINDQVMPGTADIRCWCLRPFTPSHVIMTSQEIALFRCSVQIPRWLLGIPFPSSEGTNSALLIVQSALFHGTQIFETSPVSVIYDLLEFFSSTNNTQGFLVAGQLLIQNTNLTKVDKCINIITEYFRKTTDKFARQFSVFAFLFCFSAIENQLQYRDENIVSEYLEGDCLMDIVWLFPQVIDFCNIKLSEKATTKFIKYVCQRYRIFPLETSCIIRNFATNYLSPMIKTGSIDPALPSIKAIFQMLSARIHYFLPALTDPSQFVNSPLFSIWTYMLSELYQLKKNWPKYAHFLVPCFEDFIFQIPAVNKQNEPLLTNIYRTLSLHLDILFASPYNPKRKYFNSIEEFYAANPSPLNRVKNSLDKVLFKIMSNCYDIRSQNEFTETFLTLRRYFIFEHPHTKKRLKPLLSINSMSAVGLFKFLDSSDMNDLCSIKDVSLVARLVKIIAKIEPKLTVEQQVIFANHQQHFLTRKDEFIAADPKEMRVFIEAFIFPFFFPPDLLTRFRFKLSMDLITEMDESLIINFFDSLSAVFPQLDDTQQFVTSFLDSVKAPQMFVYPKNEPMIYKGVLFCLLAVMNGARMDVEMAVPALELHIQSGSPRIIDNVMKIVSTIDDGNKHLDRLYTFLMEIISQYIERSYSIFVNQQISGDSLESIFIIIEHLKRIFNTKNTRFVHFINSLGHKQDDSLSPALFAIMNNSMEVPRSGVVIHMRSESDIDVIGTIISKTGFIIKVKDDDGVETYNLIKCTRIWFECPVTVDLHSINCFSFFFALFGKEFSNGRVNVFKYAALLDFLKIDEFHSFCSRDFFNKLILTDWPGQIRPELDIMDFFMGMSFAEKQAPTFCFDSLVEKIIEVPRSTINRVCVMNTIQSDRRNGIIMTMNEAETFVSSPLHPLSKYTLHLKLARTPNREAAGKLAMAVVLYAQCSTLFSTLESDPVTLSSSDESDTSVDIEYNPTNHMFCVMINGESVQDVGLSPGAALTYVAIDLAPSMLVEYSIDFAEGIFEHETLAPHTCQLMRISTASGVFPLTDSSVYNWCSCQATARRLCRSFRALISIEVAFRRSIKLPDQMFFTILASVCSATVEPPLLLRDIVPEPMWGGVEKNVFDYARENRPSLNSLLLLLESLPPKYSAFGFTSYNRGAIVVGAGGSTQVSSCVLYCTFDMVEVGYSKLQLTPTEPMGIVDMGSFEGSVGYAVVLMRHFIAASLAEGVYDFSGLLNVISMFEAAVPCAIRTFGNIRKIIHYLAPPIPEPLESPKFDELSFLLHPSIVHNHPKVFLASYLAATNETTTTASQSIEFGTPTYVAALKGPVIVRTKKDGSVRLQAGQFVVVEGTASMEYSDGSCIKYYSMSNFARISKELLQWRPHHSHEVLANYNSPPGEEEYESNPLSSRFCLETVRLIYSILSKQQAKSTTSLFVITRHIIMPSPSTFQVKVGQSLLVDDDFGMPMTPPYNPPVIPIKDVRELAHSTEDLTNFISTPMTHENSAKYLEYCYKLADPVRHTPERVAHMRQLNLTARTPIDADAVRIQREFAFYGIAIDDLRKQLLTALVYSHSTTRAQHWLRKFVRHSPPLVVIELVDFITGRWGLYSLAPQMHVYVFATTKEGEIGVIRGEAILILGKFRDEGLFRAAVLREIQNYLDSVLH